MCPDSLCCPQLKVWIIKVMNTFPLAAESLINPNTGCHRPIVTPRVGGPTKITSEKNSLIRLIKQVVPNGEFFSSSGQRIRHERDVLSNVWEHLGCFTGIKVAAANGPHPMHQRGWFCSRVSKVSKHRKGVLGEVTMRSHRQTHPGITETASPTTYSYFVLMLHDFAGAVPWGQFVDVTICGYVSSSPLVFCLGSLGGHCSRWQDSMIVFCSTCLALRVHGE